MWISGPILEVKKSPLINDYENIIAYSEESEQSNMYKFGFFQIHLEGSEGQYHLGKIWLFLLSFKLGSSIPKT